MDYRELLIKYIQHVKTTKGVDVILPADQWRGWKDEIDFTPEEWAELEALALIAREGE